MGHGRGFRGRRGKVCGAVIKADADSPHPDGFCGYLVMKVIDCEEVISMA